MGIYQAVVIAHPLYNSETLELCSQLLGKSSLIPIIIIARHGSTDVSEGASQLGITRYINLTKDADSGSVIDEAIHELMIRVDEGTRRETRPAEDEPQRKRQPLERIAMLANFGFWEWDEINDTPLYGSNEYVDMLGISQDDYIHASSSPTRNNYAHSIHPDDLEHYLTESNRQAGENSSWEIIYRLPHNGGTERWVREIGELSYDEHGNRLRSLGTVQDITQIKQSEAFANQKDELLEQASSIARIGFWILNVPNNTFSYLSPELSEIYGLAPENLQRQMPRAQRLDIVHSDDRDFVREAFTATTAENKPFNIEYRIILPDGSIRWIHETGKDVATRHGVSMTSVGTVQDVTEWRSREEGLKQRDILARQAESLAGIGHWLWNEPEDKCIFCSDEIPSMFDMSMEEFMGPGVGENSALPYIHPDDRKMVENHFIGLTERRESYQHEYRIIQKDGSERWVQEAAQSYEVKNGRVLTSLGTMRDITIEKQAALSLEEAEARMRAIIDTAADGIITINEFGIVQSYNTAAEEIFGYMTAEVAGKNIKMLMPEPYTSQHDEYLAAYLRTGAAKVIGFGRDVQGQRKNGDIFPMNLAVSHTNLRGETLFTGIVRDISERIEAELQLVKAKEEAEKANLAKSDFLAHMSHEFRTPLNAIRGFSEAILSEPFGIIGNEKYREYLQDILFSGKHLTRIVNDVLDISKIEAGNFTLIEDNFDAITALSECINLSAGIIQDGHGPHLLAGQMPVSIMLHGDKRVFRQILLNLLSNAVKFTPDGGTITTSAMIEDGGGASFSIADTGPGVAPDKLEVILSPFGQVRSSPHHTHDGTGLGLSLSKQLIDLHGGTLEIQTTLGGGMTVTVHFPPSRVLSGNTTMD